MGIVFSRWAKIFFIPPYSTPTATGFFPGGNSVLVGCPSALAVRLRWLGQAAPEWD